MTNFIELKLLFDIMYLTREPKARSRLAVSVYWKLNNSRPTYTREQGRNRIKWQATNSKFDFGLVAFV